MKLLLTTTVVALAMAGAASAASVDIEHAAARVTVIPEARGDVAISVTRQNPRLRLTVNRIGDRIVIDGGLGFFRGPNCTTAFGRHGVNVAGMGFIPYEELPQIVVRMPLDAKVSAGGAVFGTVDRAQSLQLSNSGCGDWTVANVAGPLSLHLAGSGDVHGGSVGSADVHISGSSDIFLRDVRNGLDSVTSGSGDVRAASISGPLHVRVAGSGDVGAATGQVSDMVVGIAGSGDVHFGGIAKSLEANIAGSGDVTVGHVAGPVAKHIAGSGSVTVGG